MAVTKAERMTWGQEEMWTLWQGYPFAPELLLSRVELFNSTVAVKSLVEALDFVRWRHEGLRTVYGLSPLGEPTQYVRNDPSPAVEIVPVADDEVENEAARQTERLKADLFSLTEEAPFRAVIVTTPTRGHALVLAMHHITADHNAIQLLITEIKEFLAGRAARLPAAYQPTDLAVEERSSAGQQRSERSLERAARIFAQGPQAVFPGTMVETEPRYLEASLFSHRAFDCADRVARRMRIWQPSLWLAIFTVVLSAASGQRRCLFEIIVSNRIERRRLGIVGHLSSTSPVLLDLSAGRSFRELAAEVMGASLDVVKYGDSSRLQYWDMKETQMRQRGLEYRNQVTFNYVQEPNAKARSEAPRVIRSRTLAGCRGLDFYVDPGSSEVFVRTDRLLAGDPQDFLEEIERVLECLVEGDVDADTVAAEHLSTLNFEKPSGITMRQGNWVRRDLVRTVLCEHPAVVSVDLGDSDRGPSGLRARILVNKRDVTEEDLRRYMADRIKEDPALVVPDIAVAAEL
ncbi:condensation domain-containing protein [Streptomyces sp. NPDC052020]|uniref:condensation domain-containing protein n=1 Tax=Streptomyces sp. NPDC052020 TaxID=3155677 RepID=UPI0034196C7F